MIKTGALLRSKQSAFEITIGHRHEVRGQSPAPPVLRNIQRPGTCKVQSYINAGDHFNGQKMGEKQSRRLNPTHKCQGYDGK